MTRAKSSGNRLNEHDAAIAKGMLQRGDRQHDVAAFFGVNSGRIAEIATGANFHWVMPAEKDELPPAGAPGPILQGLIKALSSRGIEPDKLLTKK